MKAIVKFTIVLLLVVVCGELAARAQCSRFLEEPSDFAQDAHSKQVHQKKIDLTLAIIGDEKYINNDPDCVSRALHFLGRFKVEQAIPRMVELLSFEHKVELPTHKMTRNEEYPAIAGLAGMGDAANPVLLGVIANSKDKLKRENATDALMTAHSEEPQRAIALLEKAAEDQQVSSASMHLRDAASKARAEWCRNEEHCKE